MFGFGNNDIQYWMDNFKLAKRGKLKARFSQTTEKGIETKDCTLKLNMNATGYSSVTIKTADGEEFTVSLNRT